LQTEKGINDSKSQKKEYKLSGPRQKKGNWEDLKKKGITCYSEDTPKSVGKGNLDARRRGEEEEQTRLLGS